MRVLLIEPYLEYPVKTAQVGMNIGLLSLSSYAKNHCGDKHSFFFFSQQLQKALARSFDVKSLIRELRPDVVGISSITSNFLNAVKIADAAKKLNCFVIMGGIYPSLNASAVLRENRSIDLIVRGEGERTFLRVLESFESNSQLRSLKSIKGISFRFGGKVLSTSNADLMPIETLPMPDYSLVNTNDYARLNVPGSIETARGCSFNCVFCSLRDFWQFCYRKKPVPNVLEEIRRLRYDFDLKKIMLVDDTLTLDRERVKLLFREIVKEKIDANFYILTRVDMVDTEILNLMFKGGVSQILFGVEHVEEKILSSMGKSRLPKDLSRWRHIAEENICSASKIGYEVYPVFMLGWPGENEETLLSLSDFIANLKKYPRVVPFLSFVTPHPGTRLWKRANNLRLRIVESDLNKYTHLYPVAVPYSLGFSAKYKLIKAYNSIVEATDSEMWNPLIPDTR